MVEKKQRNRSGVTLSIIRDTREPKGKGWDFDIKLPSHVLGVEVVDQKLDAGDYSLVGHSHNSSSPLKSIVVERKRSLEELLTNLGKYWDRFQRELDQLCLHDYAFIVVEDDLHNSYARYKTSKFFNFPPDFIIKRVVEIQYKYNVATYFLSNRYFAQKYVLNLFKLFWMTYGKEEEKEK